MESGTVGYSTVTLTEGWNMIAVNFQNLGENAAINIQDLIPGDTEGLGSGTIGTGDNIQLYDPSTGGYITYFLFQSPLPIFASKNYKWVDVSQNIATTNFANGTVFWYRKRSAGSVTINLSGGVSLQPVQNIDIVNGWNMIGSAFPANFNPNSLGASYWEKSGASAGTIGTGDNLQIYDPSTGGYTTYFLFQSPLPIFASKNWQWVDVSQNVINPSAEVMPISKGAWYRHRGSGFTLAIPSPVE